MSEQQASESTPGTTEVQDHGSVDPGGGLTSFDELEAIESTRSEAVRQQAVEQVAVESEKEKLTGKEEESEEKEDKKEAKAKFDDDEVEGKEEVKAATTEESEEAIEEEAARMFKALVGDEELELNGSATLKVKVDGEEVDMSLEDIINGTSGQEAIKKRFGEIGSANKKLINEKAQWTQERQTFDTKLKTALGLLNTDPLAGFSSFVEMAGMDSAKWLEAFVPKMTEQFQALAEMSDEERKVHEMNVLTQQKESRLKAKEADLNFQANQAQVLKEVKQLQAEHNIEDEDFREKFMELETLQKQGKINGEITPKFVSDVVIYDRTETKIKSVAEVVRPSMLENTQAMSELTEVIMTQDPNGEFTEDDIKDIILQAFPETGNSSDSLSKKVRKSATSKTMQHKPNKAVDPQNEPISFEDVY